MHMKVHGTIKYISSYPFKLELSLKITSDESVCTWCINERSGVLNVERRLACATCRHRRGYWKSIRVNLRGLGRIAFLARTGKAKMPNENPWQRRATLYVERVPFVERLCKYFRRRNGIVSCNGSKRESIAYDWIGYFAKRPVDNRCYHI